MIYCANWNCCKQVTGISEAHLIPGNSSSDRACWWTEDAGSEMTESKCHPEKRLRLIVPSLISGWSSQERLIWRLCSNALLHSNGSPSPTPTTSCFPRLGLDAAYNWEDNWQVPLGLYDNNPLCSRHGAPLRQRASGYSKVSRVRYIFKWLLSEEWHVIDNGFYRVVVHEGDLRWEQVLLFFPTLKRYFAPPPFASLHDAEMKWHHETGVV